MHRPLGDPYRIDDQDAPAPAGDVAVLVVDDEPEVREFLRTVLEDAGYGVRTVAGGPAALDLCRLSPPHVVLTDLSMSPMSGRDLMGALREKCPSAVPIVLTGHGTIERTVDLMRQGAFDVLTKPCRADEITSAVAKAHAHHVALQANTDLRERLKVQEKLAMIGKLAAGVAHELNNPLDAVLRCVRLTRDHLEAEDEALEYMDLAESGLRRMADIVQGLLTFSRHAAVEQAPQSLGSVVEEAISAVVLALDDRAPPIRAEIRPDVGAIPVPRGLHQVLVNLLRNACDAAGSAKPVTVRATRNGDELQLEVEDRGPGIPPDVLPRVFEPFFTTKPVGSGTGLGLPITARLVEKFGGRVSLECPSAGGTVASVVLPLVRAAIPTSAKAR